MRKKLTQKKIIVIIPARGNSKRVRKKNIRKLAGRPLIAHSIIQALQSRFIDRIFVSTDNRAIGLVARKYGAEVIWRPNKLSGDKASSESALLHVIDELKRKENYVPDYIVFLQCTSPIRRRNDIDAAIRKFLKSGADSLLSVEAHNKFIWRRNRQTAFPLNYDFRRRPREQDFPEEFKENGSIYILKTSVLTKGKNRLGGKIAIYVMDHWSSFQIDLNEDFELVEWIIRKHRKRYWP
ncbi:MAG: acylneuraminate cytidylyltransferase [Candidatus Omnitrophica bacterium CG11_big_fil_rev_8_21_14_0_20_45_26]|uniref:Acylneuraminate cytidylyltransferase n=1 Tax=Candidatus Abzuiibacterium crystallinum TaxID=1974748 RepID=A0A2H0LLW8_9BACT|nr:MAG: acylneuraminate cytidylyltransferase [Candidatus Omnitrophica bacterium CG11_big_fil_rev_8_21_14_0_20_45_26]PIW63263.1 MAG: acylneuraminate cytidylyltransferase [Candidatus Omnitrophica bacterium CG12_big_fil_rev_8_21_14_0_65_45_16]